jgi:hypothetical protein
MSRDTAADPSRPAVPDSPYRPGPVTSEKQIRRAHLCRCRKAAPAGRPAERAR